MNGEAKMPLRRGSGDGVRRGSGELDTSREILEDQANKRREFYRWSPQPACKPRSSCKSSRCGVHAWTPYAHPTLEFQRISIFDPCGTIPCPFERRCSMCVSTMCSRTMYLLLTSMCIWSEISMCTPARYTQLGTHDI